MKKYIFRFRAKDKDIFKAILSGKKKVETRAGTVKYSNISKGDTVFLCYGSRKVNKKVKKIKKYKSISSLLKDYTPIQINPFITTKKELENVYHSFPNYKEKISKFGLVAIEFEK